MKYLCLICPDTTFDKMPQGEAQRMMQEYADLAAELRGRRRIQPGRLRGRAGAVLCRLDP